MKHAATNASSKPSQHHRPLKSDSRRALASRVASLEARVAQLENGFTPRGAVAKRAKTAVCAHQRVNSNEQRCPGCQLPIKANARETCPWCGFVFDVVSKTSRKRRAP